MFVYDEADDISMSKNAAQAIVTKEKGFDFSQWRLLFGVWVVVVALVFANGGKGAPSLVGIKYCGPAYWGVTAMAVLLLFAFSGYMATRLLKDTKNKIDCGYEFAEGDIQWTGPQTRKLGG